MAQLYDILKPQNKYWDKKNFNSLEAYASALQASATVYVGNLSFYTQQNSIKELFSRAGNVKDIIMGIDDEGNPCGFCFVVYQTRSQAQLAVEYVSKKRLGGRVIRVDWDPGYLQGRQKGRGTSGQQRRQDFRNKQDPQRPRKKIITNSQTSSYNSYRNDGYNRERGDRNDRGQRGQGYRGGYRGGERRQWKQRQDRGDRGDSRGYGGQRGQRRYDRELRQHKNYRDDRENRQQRQLKDQSIQQKQVKPQQKQQEY